MGWGTKIRRVGGWAGGQSVCLWAHSRGITCGTALRSAHAGTKTADLYALLAFVPMAALFSATPDGPSGEKLKKIATLLRRLP